MPKTSNDIACVILAAGEGTRMKSDLPKVLHPVGGIPMLGRVLDTAESLKARKVIVIAGKGIEEVRRFVGRRARVVEQRERRGSGHALLVARNELSGFGGLVLVLYGDAPMFRPETVRDFVADFRVKGAQASFLSAVVGDPAGYGRVVRGPDTRVSRIVEHADATAGERNIREINAGPCLFQAKALSEALAGLSPQGEKKEYYLTDAAELIAGAGGFVTAFPMKDAGEAMGINSRKDLSAAESRLNEQNLERIMAEGVTVLDPRTTTVGSDVVIGRDSVIHPNTVIEGPARIGRNCHIGPFARIRGDVELGDGVCVGNFVELVRSKIGDRSLIKHLSYLGDALIGADVNVGAGTITANFDGKAKNKTVIEDGAEIGSGTLFVAPVKVGRKAKTGAGAVVTRGHDVKSGEVVVGIPARPIKTNSKKGTKR